MNIIRIRAYDYPYTEAQLNAASVMWNCNCGPAALATMLGVTPEDVHPHIPKFDERHYTNPSMMQAALKSLGVPYTEVDDGPERDGPMQPVESLPNPRRWLQHTNWPKYGLVRIQWEGPWCNPGVPIAARYKHTHWIGTCADERSDVGYYFFDVNCGWASPSRWVREVVVPITKEIKRATGFWHPTHRWELAL